ncbi:hypothetical protein J2848_006288 [Azospirillum lipoferum]|uniref:Flagellar hook-length control protein FliK n=1 Tax=Azospirillum lipoferum TaxID=193 RepID=A0A5A9GDB9_AZOLI|nr:MULTISPECIES: hypothetical protein [Azospirillum]KAA0592381.1 hypothetical protein FZ942_28070 [Azospirillum lipoferum]MCP1614583.1 hypothetical protein [Azospirillum lipoferum]MDW5532586.1 hypothetical protein [Azospirillum sp. NL1]
MGGAIPPSVTPVAATAAATPATPAPVTAEATVVQLPERLPEITRPVVLTGTVAGQTPEGLTRVRTAAGELLLDSAAELPADKPVTVQITPGQTTTGSTASTGAPTTALPGKPTALILLQSLGSPATPSTGSATPSPTAGSGAAPAVLLPTPTQVSVPANLPPLLPGTVVPALVLAGGSGARLPTPAAPPMQTAPAAPAPAGPSGSAKPEAPAAGTPATPAGGSPVPVPTMGGGSATFGTPVQLGGDAAHPGAETPTASNSPAPNSLDETAGTPEPPDLPRGATVALKILTVTPPPQQPRPAGDPEAGGRNGQPGNQPGQQSGGQAASQPSPLSSSQPDEAALPPDTPVLRGTVAGSTPQGQPILATKQGMLALNVPASLPQGAKVTAALADLARATQAAAPTLPGPPGPLDGRDWPAMRQLMATLAADPALAKSMLATMPQPNRKLTAALSFFLSAMRGGDAQGWLGDEATSALDKAGRRDLLERLEKDFDGLRREAAEPLPGDWRSYTIPLMDANGPKPIKLHVHPLKEDEESGGKERAKPGSRFVIDVDLSRFGPLQLDGLVRPNHFDLILRSHVALPPELRVELIQVFADSVRAVGYSGGLSFQSGARSWVKLTRAGQAGLGVSA